MRGYEQKKDLEGSNAEYDSEIPESLIYEKMDGYPIFHGGYQQVLNGNKSVEEIIGSTTIQWVIISYLLDIMYRQLDDAKYWFALNRACVQIDKRNILSQDVAIYERSVLTIDKVNTHYSDVPAKVAVEIDVKADLSKEEDRNYVNRKTQKLLNFGTDKVIWVFTDSQQVLIAERAADAWLTMNWHRDLELLDGQLFNVGKYIEDEGIKLEA